MSKGYTLSFYINALGQVRSRKIEKNLTKVAYTISPRKGLQSVKYDVLLNWVGGYDNLIDVVFGLGRFNEYGNTSRARLLKALKNRKKFGTI